MAHRIQNTLSAYPGISLMRILAAAAFLMLVFAGAQMPADAGPLPEDPNRISWHISAAKATYDQERDLYVAEGDVVIKGGQTRLEADFVEFNNTTKDAMASGHVFLVTGQDTVTCNALRINLATETGTIYKGVVFLQENNFYIDGERIQKTGEATYTADRASITSCNGPSPDWKLTGRDIEVTVEGYGFAKHVTLWAGSIPAAYTPYAAFPVKTKRQTGLLFPKIGMSDRRGFEFEQPLFIALSRSTDATLYAHYMSERGVKLAGEFRYLMDNGSKGTVMADFLSDRETDDGTSATSDYSIEGTPQRKTTDRYWLRMKHDQYFPADWELTLDLDIVSDADYLHEFKKGYSGFNASQTYFSETFGRILDDYDDTVRENTVNLKRIWDSYSLNLGLNWYDDVIARDQDLPETLAQNLPQISFAAARQPLLSTSTLYMDLESDYRYFYRKDTTDTLGQGHRADIYPRFYLPWKYGKYLAFEASAGVRQTLWHSDNAQDDDSDGSDFYHRELFGAGLEVSSRLSRVFNTGNSFADRIQHEIIPKISYGIIPDEDQEDLPEFDFVDRIEKQHMVNWSVTNRFTLKKTRPASSPQGTEAQTTSTEYREFGWFRLSQGYDFHGDEADEDTRFTDLRADIEFSPCDYMTLDADADWSFHRDDFTSRNLGILLKDTRGDWVYASHRYKRDVSESLYARVDATLTDQMRAFITLERNLYEDETIESSTGIQIQRPCWSLEVSFSDTTDDTSVSFLISLHGIGDFGTR